MPAVLNRSRHSLEVDAVYIGRPSKWGNPFLIGVHGNRRQVIAKYREYLMSNPKLIAEAKAELRGKDLLCHCAPKPCHGDVLLEVANDCDPPTNVVPRGSHPVVGADFSEKGSSTVLGYFDPETGVTFIQEFIQTP